MGEFHDFLSELGRRLRDRRKQAHLTQSALAQETGLSRITIVNIEGGQHPVKVSTLWALANKLNLSLKDLLPDEPGRIVASPFSAIDAEYANRVAAASNDHI